MERDKLDVQPAFKNLPAQRRIWYIFLFIVIFSLLTLMALDEIYSYYPKTSAGQTKAMEIARDFTLALSGKEYYKAHTLLSPRSQRLMNTPESLGAGCEDCRPVSGSWERYDDRTKKVYGTIVFEDKKEMTAEVSVTWYKGEFRITGAEFSDEETKDSRMSFLSCCDDHSYFGWIYWIIPSLR